MKKQKHLLEVLISSKDVFSRCVSILKPEYFDGDLKRVLRFVLDYFDKYKTVPDIDTLSSEYADVEFKKQIITTDKISHACDEIEQHCKECAVVNAIGEALGDIESGNLGGIVGRMQTAVSVSLQRDLGWNFFEEGAFLTHLDESLRTQKTVSTGIRGLDKYLSGGFSRAQTTIFTANSCGGKSIMLNNLAHNYSVSGHHVVLLSLEIPKEMVFTRSTAIVAGYDVAHLAENKNEIAAIVENVRKKTKGSFIMERIRGDACSNDIRSYLTHYELQYGYRPDVLLVDYLDKMTPNQGIGKLDLSQQDKFKAEQLTEVAFDYDLICATASQQNRSGIENSAPKQNVIAGGLTKVNAVDNVISLFMDDQMRMRGEMIAFFLKTRSADGVGNLSKMYFDRKSLRICDVDNASNRGVFDVSSRALVGYKGAVGKDLPGLDFEEIAQPSTLDFNPSGKQNSSSNLLDFMETL